MKKMVALALAAAMCFAVPINSYAVPQALFYSAPPGGQAIPVPGKVVTRNDQISLQQFDQILSTLRKMKDHMARGNYDFCSTGVTCRSSEEAKNLINGFKELFLSDNDFILYYNERGWRRMYVEPNRNSNGKYQYWMTGEGGGTRGIYAVWKPDANSTELLRQHDEAKKVIDSVVAAAPEDAYEKVKYYNDLLAERITYDMEGYSTGNTKRSPYNGLVEGRSVCTGYAESFFNLCYYSGISCAVSDCVSQYSVNGESDHKISMVNLDGRWKEVDVTWNDAKTAVSYDCFMVDLDDSWQQHINGTAPAV